MKTLWLTMAAALGAVALGSGPATAAPPMVAGVPPMHGVPVHGIPAPSHGGIHGIILPHCRYGVTWRHGHRYCKPKPGVHGLIIGRTVPGKVHGVAGPGHVGPINGRMPDEHPQAH